jgi:hypothetical protein
VEIWQLEDIEQLVTQLNGAIELLELLPELQLQIDIKSSRTNQIIEF